MSAIRKTAKAKDAFVAALLLLTFTANEVKAVTAREVTQKMTSDQQFAYLAGLIDMTMYQSALSGNDARSKCILDAFYKEPGKTDGFRRLNDALRDFPDNRAESIVVLLVKKICGD